MEDGSSIRDRFEPRQPGSLGVRLCDLRDPGRTERIGSKIRVANCYTIRLHPDDYHEACLEQLQDDLSARLVEILAEAVDTRRNEGFYCPPLDTRPTAEKIRVTFQPSADVGRGIAQISYSFTQPPEAETTSGQIPSPPPPAAPVLPATVAERAPEPLVAPIPAGPAPSQVPEADPLLPSGWGPLPEPRLDPLEPSGWGPLPDAPEEPLPTPAPVVEAASIQAEPVAAYGAVYVEVLEGGPTGQRYYLTQDPLRLGRKAWGTPGRSLVFPSPKISREHAEIYLEPEGSYVLDRNTPNGTFVNGIRIKPSVPHRLNLGDEITLAGVARLRHDATE